MHNINDNRPRFGPGGNGQKFYNEGYKNTIDICPWLHNMGLSAYEYQATRGLKASPDFLKAFGQKAQEYDIALSIHAPYYITMGNPDRKMKDKSIGYIIESLKAAKIMNARKVVIHLGGSCKQERKVAINNAKQLMEEVLELACNNKLLDDIYLCPETMGKPGQLGTLDEILDICTMHKRLRPTLDFGHLYAINQGSIIGKDAFNAVFEKVDTVLGSDVAHYPHIHFSPIEYGRSGEIRHRCYDEKEFGPDFSYFAESILELGIYPTVICESAGTQTEDAAMFQDIYQNIKLNQSKQ